jgi:hypothetical protein
MPRDLIERAWIEICEAARLLPDADARAEMSACLFVEYPGMGYDRERVATALRRSERMLKHLKTSAEQYRQAWLPDFTVDQLDVVVTGRAMAVVDDVRTARDLWCIAMLHRRAEATWLAACALRRANRGHHDSQREWLISRLCGIWLENFNGQHLGVSRPSRGGKPGGPLIRFLTAAMRQIMPLLPDAETLADAIERERAERQNARQLRLKLENGGLTRKKNFQATI